MSFNLNCTNDSWEDLVRDNLSWSISGMLSYAFTFLILVLLVFHKAYTSALQRLFLYFTIVSLLQLACIAMNIHLQFVFEGGMVLCKWLGFIQHWSYVMNWLFSLTLTFFLHFLVYHQIRGKRMPTVGRRKGFVMEFFFVIAVVSLPFTVLWIPISSYGLNGPLCWTRHLLEDCSENMLGGTFELVYTYCCAVVRLLIVVSFLVLFIVFCRLACLYRHTRRQYLRTVGRTVTLMSFLIVSALIELIGLLTYIHTSIVGNHANSAAVDKVLEIDYVVLPLSLAITPAGFMVYLYSLKKFSWASMKRAGQDWKWCCFCCKKLRREFSIRTKRRQEGREDATAPESNRVSAPSETYNYFSVPYTGGFTTISKHEQQSLVQKGRISSTYESVESTAI